LKEKITMLTYAYCVVSSYLATLKREEGQGMAEYGLILALVAVAVVAAFQFLRGELATLLSSVGNAMTPTGG
jgi:pilus assembly protein Flp/PilA